MALSRSVFFLFVGMEGMDMEGVAIAVAGR